MILREDADPATAIPALLSARADWLLPGGVTRLVDYTAEDADAPSYLAELERAGLRVLVRNERGFSKVVAAGPAQSASAGRPVARRPNAYRCRLSATSGSS